MVPPAAQAVEVMDLGRAEYGDVLEQMRARHESVSKGAPPVVFLVEHDFVATLGRRGEASEVFDATLPIFQIERGGKATLHGPGQAVIYPIVHLGEGNRDVRAWVRHLEQFVHDLCAHFGVETHTKVDLPGVWTVATDRKIASIGIALQDWTSMHGIAVNLSLEPAEFERIDPCGLGAQVMTNLQRESTRFDEPAAWAWIREHAASHFASFRVESKADE